MEKNGNAQVDTPQMPEKDLREKEAPSCADTEISPEETTFRVTRPSLFYRYGFIVILTLLGAGFLFLTVPMYLSIRDYLVLGLLGLWALALLRFWIYLLGMPYRIRCREDGLMELVSVLRKREIPLKEVQTIQVSPFYPSYLKIITSRKKTISMINHVTGLHELIGRIKKVNPELETKGC